MALLKPATKPELDVPASMNERMAVARTSHISAKAAGAIHVRCVFIRRIVYGDVGEKIRMLMSKNEFLNPIGKANGQLVAFLHLLGSKKRGCCVRARVSVFIRVRACVLCVSVNACMRRVCESALINLFALIKRWIPCRSYQDIFLTTIFKLNTSRTQCK